MKTTKAHSGFWFVQSEGGDDVVAEIILDQHKQVVDVVLRTEDATHRRRIKELVLSHGVQYQRSRAFRALGGLVTYRVRNRHLTESDSDTAMSFERIPEHVGKLIDDELDQALARFDILFVDGRTGKAIPYPGDSAHGSGKRPTLKTAIV